jgi:hypothetical protein
VTPAPDLLERVVAFRVWRVTGDHINSPYIPVRWDRAVAHAACYPANRTLLFGRGWLEEPHDAPHPACKCGIYGYHAPPRRARLPDPGRTTGIVTFWGRIEVHRDGMRAEHARVCALSWFPEWGSRHGAQMRAIADALGVDLLPYAELLAAAGRYGAPVPAQLIPAVERAAAAP